MKLLVLFGVGLHLRDLLFGQPAARVDDETLLLLRALVLRRDVDDAIRINVEHHLVNWF